MLCTAEQFWNAVNGGKRELFVKRRVAGIYAIRNTVNQKLYVGSAVSLYDRLYNHIWNLEECDRHRNVKLLNAWRKYKLGAFSLEVLEVIESQDLLVEREQFWLDKLDAVARGYNLSPTAGSHLGRTFGLAMRRAVAEGARKAMADPLVKARHKQATIAGMNQPEVKKKCSDLLKKRWKDPAARSLLMTSRHNPKRQQHARMKLQETLLKKALEEKRPATFRTKKYQIYRVTHPDVPTTSLIFNLKLFCLENSLCYPSAVHVLNGRMRHVGGFVFERVNTW